MKKNIVIGAVLFMLSVYNLPAQENISVRPAVSERLEKSFPGATNVKWLALKKDVSQATFHHMGRFSIAYFDRDGNIISSGRKINAIIDLPILVQTGLQDAKSRSEKKFGAVTVGHIYEMVGDEGTQYYVPLENAKVRLMLAISSSGNPVIKSKKFKDEQPRPAKNVLARKN